MEGKPLCQITDFSAGRLAQAQEQLAIDKVEVPPKEKTPKGVPDKSKKKHGQTKGAPKNIALSTPNPVEDTSEKHHVLRQADKLAPIMEDSEDFPSWTDLALSAQVIEQMGFAHPVVTAEAE